MRQVYVRWVDSVNLFNGGWSSPDDLPEEETYCETVGYLVKENAHSVYVAGSKAPEEIGSVMQIPRCAVKDMHDVYMRLPSAG